MKKRIILALGGISVFFGWIAISQAANFSFQPSTSFDTGIVTPAVVVTADVNGDGNPDVITVDTNTNNGSVLLGNGDGTLQAPLNFIVDGSYHEPNSVAVGDFNGDGKLDVIVVNGDINDITILLGVGDGTFHPTVDQNVGLYNGCADGFPSTPFAQDVATADFNGDGKLDFVTLSEPCGSPTVNNFTSIGAILSVFLGNGDGTFQSPTYLGLSHGGWDVAIADLNGDHVADIVVPGEGAGNIFLGKGDGTFQVSTVNSLGPPIRAFSHAVIADLNGDGALDIVTVDADSTSSVFLGQGNGTFGAAQTVDLGLSPFLSLAYFPRSLSIGDLNGDGKLDLFTVNDDLISSDNTGLTATALAGNGDGTFGPRQALVVTKTATDNVEHLTAGTIRDMNNDGVPDLVVAGFGPNTSTGFTTGTVNVLLGTQSSNSSGSSSGSNSGSNSNSGSTSPSTPSAGGGGGGAFGYGLLGILAFSVLASRARKRGA